MEQVSHRLQGIKGDVWYDYRTRGLRLVSRRGESQDYTFDSVSRAMASAYTTSDILTCDNCIIDRTVVCTPASTSIIPSRMPELQGS